MGDGKDSLMDEWMDGSIYHWVKYILTRLSQYVFLIIIIYEFKILNY